MRTTDAQRVLTFKPVREGVSARRRGPGAVACGKVKLGEALNKSLAARDHPDSGGLRR
jgi:hypothetical protein